MQQARTLAPIGPLQRMATVLHVAYVAKRTYTIRVGTFCLRSASIQTKKVWSIPIAGKCATMGAKVYAALLAHAWVSIARNIGAAQLRHWRQGG